MIRPADIQLLGDELAIRWSDGEESYYPVEFLRAASPSAENMGEKDLLGNTYGGTGQKLFPGVTVIGWQHVGGYAIQLEFSDKHNTGIYSFEYLRELAKMLR